MDDLNVHHFWGISPAIDLGAIATRPSARFEATEPLRILQVAPCDARHTLVTLSRLGRHLDRHSGPLNMFVYEEEPEGLARHILLLSVLLDGSLPSKERVEVFLEIHGNAFLREKTAAFLDQKGRALEALLVALVSGEKAGSPDVAGLGEDMACLANVLDLSLLKHKDRDALIETLHKYRSSVEYDMVQAWEARCRKWYGDRFDFKSNMIDWDYHMRLLTSGTPGQDLALGSIVHFHHFRHWRSHGVAYELRDSTYAHPNRSLLSKAYGRTKEFKDRSLKDVGRSVSAWGYWGDLLNGPYHAWGSACEEHSFFASSNKQFSRTAVDVAERNVLALLHELRTGQQFSSSAAHGEAHRAKVARGPTSMKDLEEEAGKSITHLDEGKSQTHDLSTQTTSSETKEGGGLPQPHEAFQHLAIKDVAGSSDPETPFLPSSSFNGLKKGYLFKAGSEGLGYYADENQPHSLSSSEFMLEPSSAGSEPAACARISEMPEGNVSASQAEEARLREAEAQLDALAWALTSSRLKLTLASGDILKNLSGRSKLAGVFDVVTLGCRHLHLAGPEYKLNTVSKQSGLLVVERARYILQLNKQQVSAFEDKMVDIVTSAGWRPTQRNDVEGATDNSYAHDVHAMFKRG